MARPLAEEPKRKKVTLRLTEEELWKLDSMTKKSGSNRSEFMYESIFNGRVIYRIENIIPREYMQSFVNLGSNINQIAKVLNTEKSSHLTTQDKFAIQQCDKLLHEIFEKVIFKKVG